MDKPQVVRPAAYVLITRHDSLLLARLCPPEPQTGKWTLPGGGLEFGESPQEAAVREAFEETGLVVELGDLVDVHSQVFNFPDRDMQALRFIYAVKSWSGELRNEHNGSTDCCAFIPFDRPHPEHGAVTLVELAAMGMSFAREL